MLSFIVAIATANNPIDSAAPRLLPDLRGQWTGPGGCLVTLAPYEPFNEPAKRPFSSYRGCSGNNCYRCSVTQQRLYPELGDVRMECDTGLSGTVITDSHVRLDNKSNFRKIPGLERAHDGTNVTKVHMIYMNHYDVGYTSFVNNVDNMYMHQYFSLAASTADAMRANGTDRFIYTTHPWLMQRFLECPCPEEAPSCPLGGVWASPDGTLYFISSIASNIGIATCLTGDFKSRSSSCSANNWSGAKCTVNGNSVTCRVENGTTTTAELSGNELVFSNGATWVRFDGNLTGLWYGPSDSQDFYVLGHNESDKSLIVWWDSNISTPLWHFGQGSVDGSTVDLLIPDWSNTALHGTAAGSQIVWSGSAGTWHRHSTQCLVTDCAPSACPARSLMNPYSEVLQCPTAEELATFSAAAEKGDIAWHGGPFNWQPENMVPELFDAGIDLVRRMDDRFYKGTQTTNTMSVRDVIYVTRSVIPLLQKRGITGLTIGSNGADSPPQVPKLHRWVDDSTGTDIVVAYHPYGYGGYGLSDCAISPNGVALCTEFRTDNTGPPKDVAEVEQSLAAVRKEFPNAKVLTSTFDAFMADVMPVKNELPVVSLEYGDTWIYGNPSDPLKMAQFRALQRVWLSCLERGEEACLPTNPVIQNMTWALLKAPEHTWGTPSIVGGNQYNTSEFRASLNSTNVMHAASSWAEQRFFNELAVRTLEEAAHPIAEQARAEMDAIINVVPPDTSEYTSIPVSQKITFAGTNSTVALGADGSVIELQDEGVEWASTTSPLASFTYQTFNETEWVPFTYNYINGHGESGSFCKQGSNNFSESKVWNPTLTNLWVKGSTGAASGLLAKLQMPTKSYTTYGSYSTIYVNLTAARGDDGSLELELTVTTHNKQPTMIGESTSLAFIPKPQLVPTKAGSSAWTIDKLGGLVDPEAVGDGGNQYCHGTWKGVTAKTVSGSFAVESLDAINANPITPNFPIGNPLPASYLEADAKAGTGLSRLSPGSVKGMGFNLHNNLWNTNYDLYWPAYDPLVCTTPYDCKTANALWRFKITLG